MKKKELKLIIKKMKSDNEKLKDFLVKYKKHYPTCMECVNLRVAVDGVDNEELFNVCCGSHLRNTVIVKSDTIPCGYYYAKKE